MITSTKRNKKQVKNNKKTLEERKCIAQQIKARFQNDIGVDVESYQAHGFNEFKSILHEYETSENLVSGFSGKIFVPEFNKNIHYILPLSKHAHEHVALVTP